MSNDTLPRLSIEITDSLARRLDDAIPWGLRGKIMRIMLEDLLNLIEQEGSIVLTALVERVITAEHILKKGGMDSGTIGHKS